MSLHYLIDGFNLLYALPELPAGTWEKKRAHLLELLEAQKPQGKNEMTVVFDSRNGMGDRSKWGAIHVVYTAGETADDWISHHVRQVKNPRVCVVVTDDQGLRRLVRGTGAKSMGAQEFWKQSKVVPVKPLERRRGVDSDEITDEFRKKWL